MTLPTFSSFGARQRILGSEAEVISRAAVTATPAIPNPPPRATLLYPNSGWLACSKTYEFPELLNTDVGTPLGQCAQTAPGVFARNYTKIAVEMDCNSGVSKIVPRG